MKPRSIRLPEDTSPHDTIIEWWYFNGFLEDAHGGDGRYAFMDCLFRANVDKVNIPYFKNIFARGKAGRYALFAHSMLADIGAGDGSGTRRAAKDVQNISLASRDTFKHPLFYANYIDPVSVAGGFVAHEMAEVAPGKFHIKTETIDLMLTSRKKPMLEGGKGFITVRGRESFYYSLTDLKATGTVRAGTGANGKSEWIPVTGRSWMDHQWADTAYAKDKWTWFSIQLENGMDIMCVEYDDGTAKDHVVDIVESRGRAAHSDRATFAPGARTWKSKTTRAEYPLSWTITIMEKKIVLNTSALLDDGEMIFGAINYWEGPVTVSATIDGKKVKGVGFMELAGYPSDYNYLLLTGQKVNARVQKEIASRLKGFWGK